MARVGHVDAASVPQSETSRADPIISRRGFLAWSALTSSAAMLAACSPTPSPLPTAGPPSPVPPSPTPGPSAPTGFFDALTAMRDALRTSPDHLVAAADRAVATGDPEAILAFVREHIATYPAGRRSTGDTLRGRRWGTRATLRGGAGTPRERADLLAELYRRAGFEAEVVRREIEVPDVPGLFRRPPAPPFEPAIDPARLADLRRVLGLPAEAEAVEPLDPGGSQSVGLATQILADLGGAPEVRDAFEFGSIRALPAVVVTTPSGPLLADPFAFGPLQPATGREPSAGDADETLEVRVALEAARAAAPSERFALVEATWPAEAITGRALHVDLVPPAESLEELLLVRPRDVQTFLPILAVRGPDLTLEQSRELSVVGEAVTLGGDVVNVDAADGVVRVGEGEIGLPFIAPARLAAVRTIEVEANPAGFPAISLLARALDETGAAVEGLPATAFAISEDGTGAGFLLQHAVAPRPRVLLLLDDSSSLPDEFRDAGAGVVARRLAERLRADDDRVLLRVAVVDGVEADPVGSWTADPAAVETAAARASGLGSQLWEALADSAKLGATAIVLVTDGAATDGNDEIAQPPPGMAARVRGGPPTVVVGVGEVRQAMLDQLGEAGGLGAFGAVEQDEAVDAVVRALTAHRASPYRFRYQAPPDGPETRTVRLAVRDASGAPGVSGTATYTVPPPDNRAATAALSGLFLRVQVGPLEAERVLAGVPTDDARTVVPPLELERVRRAMFGTTVLELEAAAPSASVLLDDLLTALLSTRALLEATDDAARLAALAAGPLFMPTTYGALTFPLPTEGDAALTYEIGLRATLHRASEIPTGDGQVIRRSSVDVLPQTRFTTALAEPATAFRRTAERTARLAVIEAAAFPISTLGLLAGEFGVESLVPIGNSVFSALDGADPESIRAVARALAPWDGVRPLGLVPADATPTAAWLLDPESGTLWGVLGDGSGGGGSEEAAINDTFDRAERLLGTAGVLGDLASLAGIGGFSLAGGVWAQLEATKLKKLRAATLMLATLRPPEGDIADLSGLGCGLAQTLGFAAAGALATRLGGEALAGAVTVGSLADGTRSLATGSGFFC